MNPIPFLYCNERTRAPGTQRGEEVYTRPTGEHRHPWTSIQTSLFWYLISFVGLWFRPYCIVSYIPPLLKQQSTAHTAGAGIDGALAVGRGSGNGPVLAGSAGSNRLHEGFTVSSAETELTAIRAADHGAR